MMQPAVLWLGVSNYLPVCSRPKVPVLILTLLVFPRVFMNDGYTHRVEANVCRSALLMTFLSFGHSVEVHCATVLVQQCGRDEIKCVSQCVSGQRKEK